MRALALWCTHPSTERSGLGEHASSDSRTLTSSIQKGTACARSGSRAAQPCSSLLKESTSVR